MKKKLLFAGTAIVLVAAAVTAFSAASRSTASDLLNANIEALTQDESTTDGEGSGGYVICYYESVVKVGATYYDCGSCDKIYDERGRGNYSKCFR